MSDLSLSEFADKMNDIMQVIAKEFIRRQSSELYKGKITVPQFLLLDFLHRQNETKMKDLAKFMKVTTAAMTGIIDRLVRDGYVMRRFEPADRRIIKAKLTSKGVQLVSKIKRQRRQMIMNIFGQLSEAERRDYLRIVMRVHEVLQRET